MEAFQMKRWGLITALLVVFQSGAPPIAGAEKIDVTALEKSVERALKAYNDGDHKKFWAEFATAANDQNTKANFDEFQTNFSKQFGKFVKRGDLLKDKSSLEGEIRLGVYKAEFEKSKKLMIAVTWVKEGKEIKLVGIQIGPLEE
jgi:hypothetical protein